MNQVVMVPFPGRGHINPMLNLCNLLSSRVNQSNRTTTVFTFVVTEEWFGLLNPDLKQDNVRFATIPNVLPSEVHRGSDMIAFLTAVCTKMERPFEEMLDQMEIPVELIIADADMVWPFEVANKRNIPVTAYWPMPASMFSVVYHAHLLESHHHLGVDVTERGKECIDYIPGISSFTVADIPLMLHGGIFKDIIADLFVVIQKANSLLLSTIYDLESDVIDVLKSKLKIPIFTSGPNIPLLSSQISSINPQPIYINWLDSKPPKTVLYVSFGSFLPIPDGELEEIAAGLRSSGVNFLWVARRNTAKLKEMCGEEGMVVEWCDQLTVLLHSSVGGFWTHCGWNSVKEGLFSGVPMLTFPIILDQPLNEKAIVEDWKIGRKVRTEMGGFKRDEIAEVVRRFMDSKSLERIGMMERAKKIEEICRDSVGDGGSVNEDLEVFVRDIVMNRKK